jgi:hypothetical protein
MKPKTLADVRNGDPVAFDTAIRHAVGMAAHDVGKDVVIRALCRRETK